MARKVNYSRKVEKIKSQIDELFIELMNISRKEEFVEEQKIKISNIDFENEELSTLMTIQTRLIRVIQAKLEK